MYARQLGSGNNYLYPVDEFAYGSEGTKQDQYVNMNIQEVLPQSFSKDNFQQGSLDFIVSTSNNYGIIWNRSAFRIDATLSINGPNGTSLQPQMKDGIAFSRYFGGNIFQGTSFALSGQTIEETTQYTPQLNVVNNRLGYSGAFLTHNKDLLYTNPNLYERVQEICSDSISSYDRFTPIQLTSRGYLYTLGGSLTIDNPVVPPVGPVTTAPVNGLFFVKIAFAIVLGSTGTLTLSSNMTNQPVSFGLFGIGVGSILQRAPDAVTISYKITSISNSGLVATVTTTGAAVAIPAEDFYTPLNTTGWSVYRAYDTTLALTNQNQKTFMFQPPLGLYQLGSPLAGEFKVSLNPHVDYLINGVQSFSDTKTSGNSEGDYKLTINNVRLYCCVVRHTFSPERTLSLKYMGMKIAGRQITSAQSNFEFNVPASSRAFTLFIQDRQVGKSGALTLSPAEFRGLATYSEPSGVTQTSTQILNLQTTYGSISVPSINYNTQNTQTIKINGSNKVISYNASPSNNMQTRYWDYLTTTGKIFSEGGSESFEDYSNSPMYVFDYSNSENSRATNLTVNLQLATTGNTENLVLYVVSHYSKVVSGSYSQNILNDISVGDI